MSIFFKQVLLFTSYLFIQKRWHARHCECSLSSVAGSNEVCGGVFSDCHRDETSSFNIPSFLLSHADDFEEKQPSIKKNDSKALARKKKEDCDIRVSKSANRHSKQKGAKSLTKERKKITRNKGNPTKEETCR